MEKGRNSIQFLPFFFAMDLHEKYKHDAMLLLGSRLDTRCWPNEVGVGHAYGDRFKPVDERRVIRYGLKGSPDIMGFTSICEVPVLFGVEVKSGNATQSKNQKNYEKLINTFNGIYLIHRGDLQKLEREFNDKRNRCRDIIRLIRHEGFTTTRGKH